MTEVAMVADVMTTTKEILVLDEWYPAATVAAFSDEDAAKLYQLHIRRVQAYDAAFDARAVECGYNTGDLSDDEHDDVYEDIDDWDVEKGPQRPVTIHLRRFEEVTTQIYAIEEKYPTIARVGDDLRSRNYGGIKR